MKKVDLVKVIKWVGLGLTVGGTIASSWSNDKENTRTLEKLVDERLNSNK